MGLAGCQTAAQLRVAEVEKEATASKASADICVRAVNSKAEFQTIFGHVSKIGTPSLAQLADQSKISDTDLVTYLAWQEDLQPCRKARLESFRKIDGSVAEAFSDYLSEANVARIELIQRKINWGEFLTKMVGVDTRARTNMQAARQSMMSQLDQQHQQEIGRRAAMAAAISAASQQVQENNLRQQQINYLNRPVNTNCTRFGNQVNCTTY